AHQSAVVAIAMLAGGNIELEVLITGVRLLLAEIPLQTARSQVRPCYAPLHRILHGQCPDAFGTLLKNAIAQDFAVILHQSLRKVRDEVAKHLLPASRKILRHTAQAKPIGMHACATYRFDDAERAFAIIKGVEDWGKLPQILCEGPIPDEVADNPEQFAKHYTDRLRARRHSNAR